MVVVVVAAIVITVNTSVCQEFGNSQVNVRSIGGLPILHLGDVSRFSMLSKELATLDDQFTYVPEEVVFVHALQQDKTHGGSA